jgi:RNA polymerase sigma-70 factor (ECF subfamily)
MMVTFVEAVSSYLTGRMGPRQPPPTTLVEGCDQMKSTATPDRFAEAWKRHRPHLVDLAFRMLGNIGDAEDVVQEAFSRLLRARTEEIEDERGWLTVVTSRLCLDQIRSARSRRERATDVGADDSGLHGPGRGPARPLADPTDRVTLDDNVRLALLVVLERLSPAERVVFVLHDIFQLPFDAIAETVGRSSPACRQLARRARKKVEEDEGRAGLDVGTAQHQAVTERFIAACANGNLQGLLEVLDPNVSGDVDTRIRAPVVGARRVASNILRFWAGRVTFVSQPVGKQPALLAFRDRQLAAVLLLTMGGDRITKIHVIADPTKLEFLRAQVDAR